MASFILKALNANPEEGSRVYSLLGQGFFTGIFLASFDVAAVAIFLTCFTDETLAWAFVASGGVGIILTYIYSFFQARVSFPTLVIGFLIIIAGSVAILTYGLAATVVVSAQGDIVCDPENLLFRRFAFMAFILALPYTYIGLLIFWGTFSRLFSLRQAKRIIGGIDTGQLLASITALFLIGYLLDNKLLVTTELFIIGLFSLGVCLIIFVFISINFKIAAMERDNKPQTMSFGRIFKSKYLTLMVGFVLISVVAATFVDFSFLTATQNQFTDLASRGAFIARFEAFVVIFSFLFQTFVTDYVIDNYGLKIALLVNPVLILLLVLGAGATGIVLTTDPAVQSYVWFFLAIAITKLFIDSLRDALDGPTFKLYFLPIDTSVRYDVTTKIEGVVNAFAAMVAGLLLITMNKLAFPVIIIVGVLVPVLIFWFLITRWMHNFYRKTLQNTLANIRQLEPSEITTESFELISPESALKDETAAYYSLRMLERLEPEEFEHSIRELAKGLTKEGRLKQYTEEKIAEVDPEIAKELAKASGAKEGQEETIYTLSKSFEIHDRIKAAIAMREQVTDDNVFVILDLLRDMNKAVKFEAIKTARIIRRPETWNILTELLVSKDYANSAAAALFASGDEVLPVLENSFQKAESSDSQVRIVRIMSKLGTEQANKYLWDKLEFPNRKIVREILSGLLEARVQVNESQEARLITALDNEIGKTIWNMAALSEIDEKKEHSSHLRKALDDEIKSNFEFIYLYLSILYDPGSIKLVQENVESGTSQGITYAIELLDIFISKEIKPKLIPLIDDISLEDRLAKLQIFYPRIIHFELQTLNYIINRDFNMINRWTKACALYSICFEERAEVTPGLIGQLFNPDKMLAENALIAIEKIDNTVIKGILPRLNPERRYHLMNLQRARRSSDDLTAKNLLLFDRALFLQSLEMFDVLSGVLTSQIADKLQLAKGEQGQMMDLDKIVGNSPLIFVEHGDVEIYVGDETHNVTGGEFYGGLFLHDKKLTNYSIKAINDSVLYILDLSDFLSVLTNWRSEARDIMARIEKSEIVKV